MKKVYNGTPHELNIVQGATFSPSIRKFVGGDVVRTIPSDGALNAQIKTAEVFDESGIPTFSKEILGCDEYPQEYDIVIVSALYASAYRAKYGTVPKSMRLVADPVMTDDGKTFRGCCGLAYPF